MVRPRLRIVLSTKIADSFQNRLVLIASNTRPSATSFSATIARGVGYRTLVPAV